MERADLTATVEELGRRGMNANATSYDHASGVKVGLDIEGQFLPIEGTERSRERRFASSIGFRCDPSKAAAGLASGARIGSGAGNNAVDRQNISDRKSW